MQGTVLAGVELISTIFHYQYPGKKKKEYQANGNQTKKKKKKNPPIVCLESQLKKKCCFNLNFCVVMAILFFSFLMTWNLAKARPFGPTPREKTVDT